MLKCADELMFSIAHRLILTNTFVIISYYYISSSAGDLDGKNIFANKGFSFGGYCSKLQSSRSIDRIKGQFKDRGFSSDVCIICQNNSDFAGFNNFSKSQGAINLIFQVLLECQGFIIGQNNFCTGYTIGVGVQLDGYFNLFIIINISSVKDQSSIAQHCSLLGIVIWANLAGILDLTAGAFAGRGDFNAFIEGAINHLDITTYAGTEMLCQAIFRTDYMLPAGVYTFGFFTVIANGARFGMNIAISYSIINIAIISRKEIAAYALRFMLMSAFYFLISIGINRTINSLIY